MKNYLVKRLTILLVATIILFTITLIGFLNILNSGELRLLNDSSVSEKVLIDIKGAGKGDDKYKDS